MKTVEYREAPVYGGPSDGTLRNGYLAHLYSGWGKSISSVPFMKCSSVGSDHIISAFRLQNLYVHFNSQYYLRFVSSSVKSRYRRRPKQDIFDHGAPRHLRLQFPVRHHLRWHTPALLSIAFTITHLACLNLVYDTALSGSPWASFCCFPTQRIASSTCRRRYAMMTVYQC
jgi:hypothetical protein